MWGGPWPGMLFQRASQAGAQGQRVGQVQDRFSGWSGQPGGTAMIRWCRVASPSYADKSSRGRVSRAAAQEDQKSGARDPGA
jgi:hypothetical protein